MRRRVAPTDRPLVSRSCSSIRSRTRCLRMFTNRSWPPSQPPRDRASPARLTLREAAEAVVARDPAVHRDRVRRRAPGPRRRARPAEVRIPLKAALADSADEAAAARGALAVSRAVLAAVGVQAEAAASAGAAGLAAEVPAVSVPAAVPVDRARRQTVSQVRVHAIAILITEGLSSCLVTHRNAREEDISFAEWSRLVKRRQPRTKSPGLPQSSARVYRSNWRITSWPAAGPDRRRDSRSPIRCRTSSPA